MACMELGTAAFPLRPVSPARHPDRDDDEGGNNEERQRAGRKHDQPLEEERQDVDAARQSVFIRSSSGVSPLDAAASFDASGW
ncbi:hypothetical protein HMSSN139_27450 [Paenibacillus sp. HMSSN-139]|nr:hypothetical protein HMSSN139_27450 [Paenibacillus sp. HMSSN-139]